MDPVRRHHLETALAPGAELADIHGTCAAFARAVRDIVRAPICVELCGRTHGHGQRETSTKPRRMRRNHAQRLARHQLQRGPGRLLGCLLPSAGPAAAHTRGAFTAAQLRPHVPDKTVPPASCSFRVSACVSESAKSCDLASSASDNVESRAFGSR
jgi:hypothetical protein